MAARARVSVFAKTYGEDDVKDYMDEIQKRAKNLKPVFHWAKRELEKANAENFTSNGLPSGGWKPLEAEYAAWKMSRFPGQPTLIRGGGLFKSLTSFNSKDIDINDTTATFSTSIEYAKFHQYGTSKMPSRKVIFEPQTFSEEFAEKITKHVVDKRISAESRRLMN
jgi:phage gpG-like protein